MVEEKKEEKKEYRKDFRDLEKEVIERGKCSLCGACVSTCFTHGYLTIDLDKEIPVMKDTVKYEDEDVCPTNCGYCYYQCPRVEEPELKDTFEEIYAVVTKDEEIRKVCQDGGVVTSIFAYVLDEGIVEGCITSPYKGEWIPEVAVAEDKPTLIKSAGTRYTPAVLLTGLADAVMRYDFESIALVGTPCQITAYRRMMVEGAGAYKQASKVKFTMGLFCTETFIYEKLMKEYLERELGINISEITKFSIEKGKFYVHAGEKELLGVKIDELHEYVREGCKICEDFSAKFADISVGSVGAPPGVSAVIIRTEVGREIFEGAIEKGYIESRPIEEVKPGLVAIRKLEKMKLDNARRYKEEKEKEKE